MADARPPVVGSVRPTVLVVGDDEPMDEAICAALDRNGLDVERVPTLEAVDATRLAAPDLVLLVGNAARASGEAVLARLAQNPLTQVVPVALLSDDAALGERMAAFRHGAVAVVPRTASVDEMARKVADIAREMPERRGEQTGELGEATFDELMKLVKQELRSGILSVEAGGSGTTEGSTAFRLVLGAGKPVAKAVEAFVAQLRPLVSKAEPLRYELLEQPGARFGLLDSETGGATEGEGDLAALRGLRVLLVVLDPVRADALASELRARGATVAVADASGRGLDRARGLDPEVVIIDAAGIEGAGFAVVKACRHDPRLRWASMLVVEWEELWPEGAGSPNMPRLASRLVPLIEPDRTIAERARTEPSFDTRLELIGPSRLLRALARVEPTLHVTVRNPRCVVDVDLSQGLVIGAVAKREGAAENAPLLEGEAALAALLALGSGRVRVERRTNPQSANVMAPVEEALALAAGGESPLVPSILPPSVVGGLATAVSAAPPADAAPFFPADGAGDDDGSGPLRPQLLHAAVRNGGPARPAAPRDLSWADSAPGGLAPPPTATPSATVATPAAGAAAPPRVLSNAFDEAATSTHAPTGKRGLVGLPSSGARPPASSKAAPPLKAPPRPKTMLGLAPALASPSAASAPATSVPGFTPASAPPVVESERPAPDVPLPLPARVPKEAAEAAAASPTQTLAPARFAQPTGPMPAPSAPADAPAFPVAPAHARAATMMGMPAVSTSHLAPALSASRPTPTAPTMTSTMPGPPTASLPPPEPLANIVLFGEPLEPAPPQPLGYDSFVIPDASVIPGGLPYASAPPSAPRRSMVPLLLLAAAGIVLFGIAVVAAALVLPRVLGSAPPPTATPVPTPALPPIAVVGLDAGVPIAALPIAALPTIDPARVPAPIVPAPIVPAPVVPAPIVPAPIVSAPIAPIVPAPVPGAIDAVEPSADATDEEPGADTDVSAGDRLVVRANRVLAAGDMRQAEVIYLQALGVESRNPHALAGLARLHLARRAGRQALSYAEQAVAVRPRRSAYRVVQGDALALLGRRGEAQRAYREALRLDPRNREARARLPGRR